VNGPLALSDGSGAALPSGVALAAGGWLAAASLGGTLAGATEALGLALGDCPRQPARITATRPIASER
jgi:hypothetical protein